MKQCIRTGHDQSIFGQDGSSGGTRGVVVPLDSFEASQRFDLDDTRGHFLGSFPHQAPDLERIGCSLSIGKLWKQRIRRGNQHEGECPKVFEVGCQMA